MSHPHNVATARKTLDDLGRCLRHIHKHIIDSERPTADHILERTATPFDFLNLLVNDSRFAWLRPFSTFMTDVDILSEDLIEADLFRLAEIKTQVHEMLLTPGEINPSVSRRYEQLLNTVPALLALHSDLLKILASL